MESYVLLQFVDGMEELTFGIHNTILYCFKEKFHNVKQSITVPYKLNFNPSLVLMNILGLIPDEKIIFELSDVEMEQLDKVCEYLGVVNAHW